jgi:hypothetical protein
VPWAVPIGQHEHPLVCGGIDPAWLTGVLDELHNTDSRQFGDIADNTDSSFWTCRDDERHRDEDAHQIPSHTCLPSFVSNNPALEEMQNSQHQQGRVM